MQGLGRNGTKFKERTERLSQMGVIDEGTQEVLDWIWDIRSKHHFMDLGHVEFAHYKR